MISPRCLVSAVLAWFALSTGAPARAGRVAALQPRFDPPVSAEMRDRFHEAMGRGLQQGGAEVVPGAEVRTRLGGNEELAGCVGGACAVQALAELKAERLALGEIAVSGKSYIISLRLLDQGGAEMWRATERCDICSAREADEAVAKAAARMAPWVGRPGPTDQARAAAPPPPAVVPQPVPPAALAPTPSPEPRRWTPYRYGWIVSAVVGGAFLVTSIPFLVYAARENQTTCDPSVPVTSCPTVYKGNLGAGLGLLLGGAVAAGGGGFAVFYYLDRQAQKKPRLSLSPVIGGAGVGVEGRF
jgi:hypothetical protein